jgi:hypothetical protein
VTGGAHDTLRDELFDTIERRVETNEYGVSDWPTSGWLLTDAVLPVVLRYADAQVAAERERLAAVRALLDPDAEMATWVVGHRYFEEADIRRALDGEQP